jgi:ribose transport system substrate-binding protein
MKVLNALLKGDRSVIPDSKFIDIEARTITKENVDSFWDDLKAKKSG